MYKHFSLTTGFILAALGPVFATPTLDSVSHNGSASASVSAPTPGGGNAFPVSSTDQDFLGDASYTHATSGGDDTFTRSYFVDTTVSSSGGTWTLASEFALNMQAQWATGVGQPVSFNVNGSINTIYTFTLEQDYSYVLTGEIQASVTRPASAFTGSTTSASSFSLDRSGGPSDIEHFTDNTTVSELPGTPVTLSGSGTLSAGTYTLSLGSAGVLSGTGTTPGNLAFSGTGGNFSLALTAIPEPCAGGLILVGILALQARRRRRPEMA